MPQRFASYYSGFSFRKIQYEPSPATCSKEFLAVRRLRTRSRAGVVMAQTWKTNLPFILGPLGARQQRSVRSWHTLALSNRSAPPTGPAK